MKTPKTFTLPRIFLFSTLLSLLLPASLLAQTTAARPDRGIMPGASYSVSDTENVSLTNGNVQLTIPLASLPSMAGGKLKYTVNAIYNSKLWNVTRQEQRLGQFYGCPSWVVDTPQLSDLGGWRVPIFYQIAFRNAHEDFDYDTPAQPPTPDCETDVQEQGRLQSQYYRAILTTPDGAEHELRPVDNNSIYGGTRSYLLNYYKDTPTTVNGAMRYYSFDGSYLYAVINPAGSSTNWTVYMNDGTRIVQYNNGIQRITDTNGNNIKIFNDANGGHVQDELTGREIKLVNNTVQYQTVTGIWQTVSLLPGTTQVQGKIYQVNDWHNTGGETGGGTVCVRNDLLATSVPVIREIVFPATESGVTARKYTFSYNSDTTSSATDDWHLACGMAPEPYTRTVSNGMGELSQMTTPSGAVVNYSYSKSSIHNFSFDINDIPRSTVTQKQVIHDGITETWNYDIVEGGDCGGTVTAPDGSESFEQCYPHDPAWARFFGYADDRGGLTYRSIRSDKEMVERHWIMLPFTGANTGVTGSFGTVTFNPVVDVEYLTLLDDTPSHNPVKMSAKKYQYDFNGNVTQEIDYDWFDPAGVTRGSDGVPTGVPVSATVLRTTNNSHYNQAGTASSTNVYAKRSLSTATPLILNAPQQTTLGSSIVQLSYDGQSYGVEPTVGNVTSKRVWDDLDNKWITTSSTYDVYGNVATATDGRGKITQYFYDDATHARPNRVVVDPQNGTGAQTTTTAYDFATGLVTSVTDPNNVTSTIDYTNLLLSAIDPFGRPGIMIGPLVNAGGGNQHHRVTTTYEDHLLRYVVASDLNAENDKLVKTRTTSDMLGRTVLVEQTEDGTNYTLRSQQAYAQGGLITFSSSMMRTGVSSNTDSWTRVTNDLLGRPIEVSTFGGATQPPNTGTTATASGTITTAYSANFTTVTDQAGKVRRSMVDALGRLIRVDEPDASNNLGTTAAPVQPTSYAYDVFGNLTTVTQGSQTRTFTYDSISRLRTALNPESGSIGYQYDDNGNLAVKTDARGVSSHFEYDSLNRVTRRWYNGSTSVSSTTHNTPALPLGVGATDEAKFYYDTQTLPGTPPGYSRGVAVGRLVAQTYGAGTNGDYYTYDALGHATSKFQQIGTFNYQVTAVYNLSGALTGVTYPSGHTITNAYDQAGRLTTFSGNLGDNITRNYASGILYTPVGGPTWEQYGTSTSTYHKSFYNSRGQLFDTRVSSVNDTWDWNRGRLINYYSSNHAWGQSGTDNNGNLLFAETWIPPANATLDQADTLTEDSYTYDSLNRLTSVAEQRMSVAGGWGNWTQQFRQQYAYDRYGNRTIDGAQTWGTGINNKQFTVDTATNRLGVPGGQTGVMSYDTAGNLTNDTYTGAGNRTYDAENKITSAVGGSSQTELYAYDAGGQRIKRTVDGVTTWQVYGFGGELLAEYPINGATTSPQKEYGYRNGQLLITAQVGSPISGLVGQWKLDENTGATTADASGSGNSGTLTSGATWGTGQSGSAVSFDGVDDYVQVGAPSSLVMTSAVSLSAWIYPTGAGSNGTYGGTILVKEGEYVLARFPNGKIQWGFANTNPGWLFVDTGYTAALNQWTHIAVTYDNGTIKTFANGTLVNTYSGSGTIGDAIPAQNDFRIGGRQAISQNFQGRIDEVRVYNRALTATEVSSLVSAPTTTINWLVTDHLGTPRIILDQTGSFVSVKRHDYLPFGEELFAPTGGRSTTQGYSASDGIRQQFTSKERDKETGLDYFLARYYSSTQGRFTNPDEFKGGPEELFGDVDPHDPLFYAEIAEPQSLNKYQYCLNNPLRYIDPDGHQTAVADTLKVAVAGGTVTGQPEVVAGAGIALVIYVAVDQTVGWDKVGNKLYEVFKGSGSGCAAGGVVCGPGETPNSSVQYQQDSSSNAEPQQGQQSAKPRGSQNPNTAEAAAEGRRQHQDFKEKVKAKPGWQSEPALKDPKTGNTVKPDAVTPSGRPVELKPNTASGRRQGQRQLPAQERATGRRGRVVYYDPKPKNP